MSILLLFVILLVLMLFGAPVAAAIGLTDIIYLNNAGYSFFTIIQRIYSHLDSTSFLALPGFVIAGFLMDAGGMAKRLISLFELVTGKITGGLGVLSILASGAFGTLSGSSQATTAAIGSITVPEMEKRGYPKEFGVACSCAGGVLGVMIPPSTAIVLYAVTVGASITLMFQSHFIYGGLMTLGGMILVYFMSRRMGIKKSYTKTNIKQKLIIIRNAIPAILFPIIVFGAIFAGFMTPTESSAFAILYSLVVGVFVYKELTLKKLIAVMVKSVRTVSAIVIITSVATCFGWIVTAERVSNQVLEALLTLTNNKYIILILVNIFLLILGCFMNGFSIILLAGPILAPLAASLGVPPVQFGTMFHVAIVIGFLTPPFGQLLFVGSSLFDVPLMRLARSCIPFVLLYTGFALLLVFVPIFNY